MPDIAKILKNEISRIARRETKKATAPSRGPAQRLRRAAAELRRKVAVLEKELASLRKTVDTLRKTQPTAAAETADKARITAKGVRSLRRRLRLTGQDFAKLLGVTGQVVYRWEKATGPLRVRRKTKAAILAIRDIGAREARRRVGARKVSKRTR